MITQSRIMALDNGEPCWNTTSMDNLLVQTGEPLETGHVNQPRPTFNGERCYSIPRAAKHFGVGGNTIRSAIHRGEIPHFRLGGLYRIRLSEVPQGLIDRWERMKATAAQNLPKGQLVYFVGIPGFVKIGVSHQLTRRIREMQVGSPYTIELLAHIPGGTAEHEREYHRRFRAHCTGNEWFRLRPDIQAEIDRLNREPSTPVYGE